MKVFTKGFVTILLIISATTVIVCASVVSSFVEENMVWTIKSYKGENGYD